MEPRQMNEDGLDVREANVGILLALFHRNFSKFGDHVRGAVTKSEEVSPLLQAALAVRKARATSSNAHLAQTTKAA